MGLILIVDDCRMTRRILSIYLQEAGWEVDVAENGLEAMEKLAREPYALVIADLNMPHMDGLELTRSIKSYPFFYDVPVIILTTQGEESERVMGMEAGASAFLRKPISQKELVEEVSRLVPRPCVGLERRKA